MADDMSAGEAGCGCLIVVVLIIGIIVGFTHLVESDKKAEEFNSKTKKVKIIKDKMDLKDAEEAIKYETVLMDVKSGKPVKGAEGNNVRKYEVGNFNIRTSGGLKPYQVGLEYNCDKGSGKIKQTIIVVAISKEQVRELFVSNGMHKLYSIAEINEVNKPTLIRNR